MIVRTQRQDRLVEALAELEWPEEETEGHERVTALVREGGISYSEFRELDEKPGRWGHKRNGSEWHWKLRRTRNAHRPLFDALSP